MAVAAVTVSIDGRELEVAPGSTLREACRAAEVEIPTLCFNPNFSPANACRLCVVELEGSRTLVASCSRAAEQGMRVLTGSERVRHSRRMVLEFLGSSVDLSLAAGLAVRVRAPQRDLPSRRRDAGPHAG